MSYQSSLNDTFKLGKYKGTDTTVKWAIENDIHYVKWALLNTRFDLDEEADLLFCEEMLGKTDATD